MAPNFGKYAIVDAVEHHFEQEPDWYWKIRPVLSGEELERTKFMLHNRVVQGPDGVRRELPPSWMEIAWREIALTFGGTNIPRDTEKPVEAGGEPILLPDARVLEIEAVLRIMPQGMVMEIWKKIGETYPNWGPTDPNLV